MRTQRLCSQCKGLYAFTGQGQMRHASTTAKAARLSRKSVLEVSGPDTPKFLKGLTCKDVEPLGGGYSGFMNATGRLLHTVFIFPVEPDRYLITHESPSDHPAPLQKYLSPFKLRAKVRFKDVSADWDAWAVWNTETPPATAAVRTWRFGSGGASEAGWSWPNGVADLGLRSGEVGCWDLRTGNAKRLLSPKGSEPEAAVMDESDYDLHRMTIGVPEGQREIIPGSALPLESCMDIHGGVDVRKGCYVGQELTVRTYHTGATRKRILPIRLFPLDHADTPLPSSINPDTPVNPDMPGEIMYHPPASSATRKPKSAGRVLTLHDTYGTVGLGLVRLELVDRTWWSQPAIQSVGDWLDGEGPRLTTFMGGKEYGVFVGKGEAYAAALENAPQ